MTRIILPNKIRANRKAINNLVVSDSRLLNLPNSTLKNVTRDKLKGANHKKVRIEKPKNANDSYISKQALKEFYHVTANVPIIKGIL